jgi:hypothetical protein
VGDWNGISVGRGMWVLWGLCVLGGRGMKGKGVGWLCKVGLERNGCVE